MILHEIHITEFGCFQDRSFSPERGINLISGVNEAGKSTLLLFIKFMFYGLPRSKDEKDRYFSWSGRRAAGTLTFSDNNRSYRIERNCTGTHKDLHVYDGTDGSEIACEGKEPGEFFFGVNADIFESTCGIGQMRCAELGNAKVSEKLSNLLSAANEDVNIDNILKELDKARKEYRLKKGKGGKLDDLNEEVYRTKEKLSAAQQTSSKIAEAEAGKEKASAALAEAETEYDRIERRINTIHQIQALKRFENLHQKEQEEADLKTRKEKMEAAFGTDRTFPTEKAIAALETATEQLEEREKEVRNTADIIGKLKADRQFDPVLAEKGEQLMAQGGTVQILSQRDTLRQKAKKFRLGALFGFASALAGGILALLGGMKLIPATASVAVGAVLAVLGIALGIYLLSSCGKTKKQLQLLAQRYGQSAAGELEGYFALCEQHRKSRENFHTALLQEENNASRLKDQCLRTKNDLILQLRNFGTEAISEDIPSLLARATTTKNDLRAFLNKYHEFDTDLRVLHRTNENERTALSVYDEATLRRTIGEHTFLDVGSLDELNRKRDLAAKKKKDMQQKLNDHTTELNRLNMYYEDPLTIADRLAGLEEQLKVATAVSDAIELAQKKINQAAQDLRGNLTPTLSREAGMLIQSITDGKYSTFQVTNQSLHVSLLDEEQYQIESTKLSSGTRDAAYFALRIALMKHLFPESLPPLLMDETLCQVDDIRAARILTFLAKLSANMQCLLFTCHTREEHLCREGHIDFHQIVL